MVGAVATSGARAHRHARDAAHGGEGRCGQAASLRMDQRGGRGAVRDLSVAGRMAVGESGRRNHSAHALFHGGDGGIDIPGEGVHARRQRPHKSGGARTHAARLLALLALGHALGSFSTSCAAPTDGGASCCSSRCSRCCSRADTCWPCVSRGGSSGTSNR